ncbi:MAG: LemA family protein [Rikenellaceae bacterium]|nr:LemA family protein [Rikenellaceae bacterium]
MKKSTIITIAVIALVAIWGVGAYNGFVQKEENVKKAWSQVENQYQRRSDLIPNLVSTVKGYAAHESETLESVIAARSAATAVSVDASNLTAESIAQYQQAQGQVGAALGRLIALSESYPDLKANQNFLELQAQLEGTENRITVERKRFNDEAQAFNSSLRKFPNNIIGSLFGFEPKAYFEAAEGASQAPVVEF